MRPRCLNAISDVWSNQRLVQSYYHVLLYHYHLLAYYSALKLYGHPEYNEILFDGYTHDRELVITKMSSTLTGVLPVSNWTLWIQRLPNNLVTL